MKKPEKSVASQLDQMRADQIRRSRDRDILLVAARVEWLAILFWSTRPYRHWVPWVHQFNKIINNKINVIMRKDEIVEKH